MTNLSKTENRLGSVYTDRRVTRQGTSSNGLSVKTYLPAKSNDSIKKNSVCREKDSWPSYLNKPHTRAQKDCFGMRRNHQDYLAIKNLEHIPVFYKANVHACVKFKKNNKWLGPWYAKIVAGLEVKTEDGARICFNLKGGEKGLILNNENNSLITFQGISFDSWNETARPREIIFNKNQLILNSTYRKNLYYFWEKTETLSLNLVKKFSDTIPTYYQTRNGHRLNNSEYKSTSGSNASKPNEVKEIPLLHSISRTGKFPNIISLNTLKNLTSILKHSFSEEKSPKDIKGKIAQELVAFLSDNIKEIKGSFTAQPKSINLPGFFAEFEIPAEVGSQYAFPSEPMCRPKDVNSTQINFSAQGLRRSPYRLDLNSNIELKHLYMNEFLDMGKTTAKIRSTFSFAKNESEFSVKISDIDGKLNPFSYGKQSPDANPLLEIVDGRISSGKANSKVPAGFSITKNKRDKFKTSFNLTTTQEIKTPFNSFKIGGNLSATLEGHWSDGERPKSSVGKNRIEINDFEIKQAKTEKALISNARLVITDDPHEKKLFTLKHPEFRANNPGFIVKLTFDHTQKNNSSKGYVMGFIPAPLDDSRKFYDPQRFSNKHTLNLALGLVVNKLGSKIEGQIQVSKTKRINYSSKSFHGNGIKVSGELISISGPRVRHLVKKGLLKIISNNAKNGSNRGYRNWYAFIQADQIDVANKVVNKPYIEAKFSTYGGRKFNINVKDFLARFYSISSDTSNTGEGMLSGKFNLDYEGNKNILTIKDLLGRFKVHNISPSSMHHLTHKKIASFDADGYLKGHWTQNLQSNRGHGWIGIIGDKEGDIHLRDDQGKRIGNSKLGRETPLFSDTRWIALRIDNIDSLGWINGQFCLRTDIDPLALKNLGVKHSDYFEWRMSHKKIGPPFRVIEHSQNYYNKLITDKFSKTKHLKRNDPCARIFKTIQ